MVVNITILTHPMETVPEAPTAILSYDLIETVDDWPIRGLLVAGWSVET